MGYFVGNKKPTVKTYKVGDAMDRNRHFRFRDFGVGILSLVLVVLLFVFSGTSVSARLSVGMMAMLMIGLIVLLLFDRSVLLKRYNKEHNTLASDLKLQETLYQLFQKTSSSSVDEEVYQAVLKAAIGAVSYGSKGSIIDVRHPEKVRYVAVEGFKKHILEQMNIGLKDTYLYKETNGAMNRTVVIENSVNYNQLHANDELVNDLIEAGTARVRSTLSTPIVVEGKTIGMLNIDSLAKDAFTEQDIQVIEIFAMEVGKMIRYYEMRKENIYLSHYDAMTKIYNRGYFYNLHKELFHSNPKVPYVFVSTDIDNLKKVNDTYGHALGDKLIIQFVEGLKKHLPESAIFGRYGGDEFNLLLPNFKAYEAEKIMTKAGAYFAKNPIECEGETVYVAFSYGIARYPEEISDYKQLIIEADKRMYAQKHQNKSDTWDENHQ